MDDAKKKKELKDPKTKKTVQKSKLPDESSESRKADEIKNPEVAKTGPPGSDEKEISQEVDTAAENNTTIEDEEKTAVKEIVEQQKDDSADKQKTGKAGLPIFNF